MKKAILIDLDGTLIDSIPYILKSYKATIEHFGFKVSRQKLRDLAQLHSRDVAYYLMDKHKVVIDVSKFVEWRRNHFLKLLKNRKENWFDDSKEFIESASKKYKVAIVTGSRWIFIKAVFDKKTKSKLKYICTSDDVEHKKPDIEPLEQTLNKLKLKKSQVIFIGDSTQDGLMCQRYGVEFIAKETGISTKYQLKKFNPKIIAKDFEEVKDYLKI
jgi:HAD superfamily hydrolase (TIGR01549 family)